MWRLALANPGKTILVFSHAGNVFNMCHALTGESMNGVAHASVSSCVLDPAGRYTLERLADGTELRASQHFMKPKMRTGSHYVTPATDDEEDD